MPWQEHAADVIGEVDPLTGLRRWPLVLISVPRQSGKTRLIGAACLQRALQERKSYVWYTAQTGQHARRNWLKFTEDILESDFPLHSLFDRKKSRGDEQLIVRGHRSTWCPHPPTEDSLHGEQGDLNVVDEGWVFDEVEGAALMQAITPTHATRPGAQTIIISTRGTSASIWFHDLLEKAKSGEIKAAVIDYGIPDDTDPADIDEVAKWHPAVGFTQSVDSLRAAFDEMGGKVDEFARAYGNRETKNTERFIPADAWEKCIDPAKIPDAITDVHFGAAVSADRESAFISVAAMVEGTPVVEIVESRRGYRWVIPRVKELIDKNGGTCLYDAIGTSDVLRPIIEKEMAPMREIRSRELTAACADMYARITHRAEGGEIYAPEIAFRPHPALDTAAEIVTRKRVGDGWAWDRRNDLGSIAALESATLAVHAATTNRAPVTPMIFTG